MLSQDIFHFSTSLCESKHFFREFLPVFSFAATAGRVPPFRRRFRQIVEKFTIITHFIASIFG